MLPVSPNEPKQERTPAQERWEMSITKRDAIGAAFQRAEEVGIDVRALAATVAEQGEAIRHREVVSDSTLRELYVLKQRLAALERGQGTLSQSVQSLDRDHVGLSDRLAALESPETLQPFTVRVTPENEMVSPGSAEAAPEPVCQCGCPKSDHNKYGCMSVVQAGLTKFNCGCPEYVPAEQAVQEPPALSERDRDKAIVALFDNAIHWMEEFRDCERRGADNRDFNRAENNLFPALDAIRAYGGDAREGGK